LVGVVVIALGGYYGWAALAALIGISVYLIDDAVHDNEPCSCEGGKVRSPLTRKFRWHKACGGKGIRRSIGRRIFNRDR
jgi:hypothetical protein